MVVRVRQDQDLQQKFQIQQGAMALFEVDVVGIRTVPLAPPALAHATDLQADLRRITLPRQDHVAPLAKALHERRVTGHRARAHQGLVLPDPGPLLLVFDETVQAGHQHALGTVRPQPRIDFIQATTPLDAGKPVHYPLRQSLVPAHRFQGSFAIAALAHARFVIQKHQIKVGREAQLAAAE